jgi:hypothetical protein
MGDSRIRSGELLIFVNGLRSTLQSETSCVFELEHCESKCVVRVYLLNSLLMFTVVFDCCPGVWCGACVFQGESRFELIVYCIVMLGKYWWNRCWSVSGIVHYRFELSDSLTPARLKMINSIATVPPWYETQLRRNEYETSTDRSQETLTST